MNKTAENTDSKPVPQPQDEKPSSGKRIPKRYKKIALITFLSFSVLIILLNILIFIFINPLVKYQIRRTVALSTDSLYTIDIGRINISLFNATLSASNLKLKKNLKRWREKNAYIIEKKILDTELEIKKITTEKIKWFQYFQTGKLQIHRVSFIDPHISFRLQKEENGKSKKQKLTDQDLYNKIWKFVDLFASEVKLQQFLIVKGNFIIRSSEPDEPEIYLAENFNLQLNDIRIFTDSAALPIDNLKVIDFSLMMDKAKFTTPDKVYEFSSDYFSLSSKDSSLHLINFKAKPLSMLKLNSLNNIKKYRATRFDVEFTNLFSKGIDYRRLLRDKEMDVKKFVIEDLKLKVENDKYLKKNIREDSLKALKEVEAAAGEKEKEAIKTQRGLKQALRELPVFIRLDTLQLDNAAVKYYEKNLSSSRNSYHTADSIHLTFYNLHLGRALKEDKLKNALYSETVTLSLKNYEHQPSDGFYKVYLGKARLSSADSMVYVENAYVKPLISNEEFASRKYYQSMKIEAKVGKIVAEDFDLERFAYRQEFDMGRVLLVEPVFDAYLDKTKPKKPGQKYQNFDHLLQTIPIYLDVDQFIIQKASFAYTEKSSVEGNTGYSRHKADHINVKVENIQLGKALNFSALERIDTKSLLLSFENYDYSTPNGLFHLFLSKLDVSSAESRLTIDSLVFEKKVADSLAYLHQSQLQTLQVGVNNILGRKINFKKMLLFQEFDWGFLELYRPTVSAFTDKRLPRKTREVKDSLGLREILTELPVFIKLDSFVIREAFVEFKEQHKVSKGQGLAYIKAKKIDLLVPGIRLGKAVKAQRDSLEIEVEFADNFLVNLENYEFVDKNGIYKFTLEDIRGSLEDSVLLIEKLQFRPLMSQKEFVASNPYQALYVSSELQSIRINDIDLSRLVFDREIVLKSLNLQNPNIDLYIDKFKPPKPDKKSLTAEELLKAIPIFISVDSLTINDATLRYSSEVPTKTGRGTAIHKAEDIDIFALQTRLALNRAAHISGSEELMQTKDFRLMIENYEFVNPEKTYVFSCDKLTSYLTDSLLLIDHLRIKPLKSKEAYDKLQYKTLRFDADIGQVECRTADLSKFLDNKGYVFHTLKFKDAFIDIYQNKGLPKDTTSKTRKTEAYIEQIPYYVKLDSFIIDNASVRFTQKTAQADSTLLIEHLADSMNLVMSGLLLDSNSLKNEERILFSENLSLRLRNYQTQSKDQLYRIKMDELKASTYQSTLKINGFYFLPTLAEDQFARQMKMRTERFKITVAELDAERVNFRRIYNQKVIDIGKMRLDELELDVYMDKSLPKDSISIPKMPNLAFQKIPIALKVDSLNMSNSVITYREKAPDVAETGTLFFSDISLQVINLNNRAEKEAITSISAESKLLNEGQVNFNMDIPLNSPEFKAEMYGKLGKMNATFFNSMIEANQNIRIKKGNIQKVKYQFSAIDTLAKGELTAGYKKLMLEVFDKETQRKKGLITFLANLIIKNRNNVESRKYKEAKIYYRRKSRDSFFTFLWRSLASGIVDTLK